MDQLKDPEGLEVDQILMAVVVMRNMGVSADDSPKDIGIVIEGVQVITVLKDIATACGVLFGLTYVLNLHYPSQLKQTFEVFQKFFLEVDALKLSNKVQLLKSKLLARNITFL
ncbi:hypothetical protein AOLI_G00063250 [Acnodon oligacanthus]